MDSYNRLQLVKNDKIKTYGMSSNYNSKSYSNNLIVVYIVFLLVLLMMYML